MVIRFLLRVFGVFCLIFTLIPFAFYGILNVGVAGLGVIGLAAMLLPSLWHTLLEPRPKLRIFIAAIGVTGLTFCLAVSALIARQGWFTPPPNTGEPVIVLGSKINGDRPSLMLWRRLHMAAQYLEHNPGAVCVVSGGQGPDEDYPEALVMRDTLVEMGIDPVRVLMEDRSSNTRENLRYSRELLDGADRAVISTDGFHQLRASVFARAEGLETWSVSSLTPWGLLPSYWLREILGVCWAWVTV